MKRLSLLAIGSLFYIACGGGDGNSDRVCGNGRVDTGEQCDDGNTSSGDGCSETCTKESSPSTCGDGVVDVATETCDDGNTVGGDGCSATCHTETVNKCGNGHLDTGEACDDSNTTAGDGCSATCTVEAGYMCSGEPSTCMVMTQTADGTCAAPLDANLTALGSTYTAMGAGDTSAATNQVAGGACDSETSSGAGPDQIWKFVNPVAQPVLITIHHDATTFDAVLRLTSTACDVSTQIPDDLLPDDADDDGASDGCADLHSASTDERLNYNNLAAGTYYLVIDGYSGTSNGMYSFSIQGGSATCGNGVVEPGETCDDSHTTPGDGCDATCQTEPGYGCTGSPSVCTIIPGSCQMPTTLTLTQTGNAYDGTGTGDTTNATNSVAGAACDGESTAGAGHDQVWTFTNPVAQAVSVTLTPQSGYDAVLRMTTTACDLSTQVDETILSSDAHATADGCADRHASGTAETLTYRSLPAGTYSIVVDGYFDDSAGMYTLAVHGEPATCGNGTVELGESCDDTNTTTGDGCSDTCNVEPGYGCTTTSPSVCTVTCGNGVLDDGEDCDDTNTTDGDGCSATCTVESGYDCGFDEPSVCVKTCGNGALDDGEECDGGPTGNDRCKVDCTLIFDVAEVEPNDTTPQALSAIPHQVVKGTLDADDIDLYTFTLAAPATIEIETYDSSASIHTYDGVSSLTDLACYDDDNEIRIFDATGDVTDDDTALIWDDQDGDESCAYLGPSDSDNDSNTNDVADPTQGMLPAGTYTIKINDYFGDAETRYLFDLRIEPAGPVVAPHRAPPASSIVKRLRPHPRKGLRRANTHR